MLVYPRALCVAVGKNDELFKIYAANSEIERLSIMSNNAYGNTEWFTAIEFDGAHEFIPANDALEWFINKLIND